MYEAEFEDLVSAVSSNTDSFEDPYILEDPYLSANFSSQWFFMEFFNFSKFYDLLSIKSLKRLFFF